MNRWRKYIKTYDSKGNHFLLMYFHTDQIVLSWLKNMSKDESLVIKVQKGHINIKISISPTSWKTQAVIISIPNNFKHSFSYSMVRFQPLMYSMGVFFNLGEGWGGIECLGRDKGVGKSMEGQSTEVACLTFTHPFHTEPPQSRNDIEILYRLWVKLWMWKGLAHRDITH